MSCHVVSSCCCCGWVGRVDWIRFVFSTIPSSSIITIDSSSFYSLLFIVIMIYVTIDPPSIEIEDLRMILLKELEDEFGMFIHGCKQFHPQPRSNLYHR
mmetsp:Transcript_3232/g.3576  ORF Transcript_3232/g.3576 Transcript_3232/m.3576 type:complete len:99 (-) Transcript_3232:241-537(-)